jgi:hypothetical protein
MLSDLLYRLRALFRRNEMDADVDDELRDHLEREAKKYRRAGLTPNEAVRRAHLALGGSEQVKQQSRDSRGTKFVEDLLQDLRYAMRSFAKTPGLSFMIVLSLAIGIGANTAIFSVTNTLLLKPLPYPAPDRHPMAALAGHRHSARLAFAWTISRHRHPEPCIRRHGARYRRQLYAHRTIKGDQGERYPGNVELAADARRQANPRPHFLAGGGPAWKA